MRDFHLHVRKGVYYVQFVDQKSKKRLSAISTRKRNRDEALLVVYKWQKEGIPSRKEGIKLPKDIQSELSKLEILDKLKDLELNSLDIKKIENILAAKGLVKSIIMKDSPSGELLNEFLLRFWDYDESPYVKEKLSHKVFIGKTHAIESSLRAKAYWIPFFKGKALGELTRKDIMDFTVYLQKNYPERSPVTLKSILSVGVTALRWAFANQLIAENPTIMLPYYSSKRRKRGVLTPEEAVKLFKLTWYNDMAKLANIVAMITGLRKGEIIALRVKDIGEEYISVEQSYSRFDGFKSTKTDEDRRVPILPRIRDTLLELGRNNPHGEDLIFWNGKPGVPMSPAVPSRALKNALICLTAGQNPSQEGLQQAKEYWSKRNVVFHSWRHFYSARMADKIEARKVMLATGHKTETIFRGYAEHGLASDLSEVAVTTGAVFEGLLPETI